MGHPQVDVMEGKLPLLGFVPYRPIGQSHFVAAPWQTSSETPYQPAVLSENALRKGVEKVQEPLPPPLDDVRLDRVYQYMIYRLAPIWSGNNELSYEEAVGRLNWEKSPGYPYYYTCEDKACAMACYGGEIKDKVNAILAAHDEWCPYTLTLKDELRTAERVAQEKTRPFSACNFPSLIASKMLFDRQNDKLRKTLLEHPLTIGISVPGPQFVTAKLSLGDDRNVTDGDASGCDQRYYLPFARLVRELRKAFQRPEWHAAIDKIYDDDFASDVITCGCVYRMLHGKSGRNNTGDDNGLLLWMSIADYVLHTTNCAINDVDRYFTALINGDDSDVAWYEPCTAIGWREHCKQFNLQIELGSEEPKFAIETTFLSHHLRERFIHGLGDVLVAAGNHSKLVSSLQWIRRNSDFSVEENAIVHLLGLRINFWPWKHDFEDLEETLDGYLSRVEITPRIRNMLKARISEKQIMSLHFRFEEGFKDESFLPALERAMLTNGVEYHVRDSIISVIFEHVDDMPTVTAAELARRKAQSKRDKSHAGKQKAKSKSKPKKGGGMQLNSGKEKTRVTAAPAALGYESKSHYSVNRSNRFKDGIVVEGADHLEYVVVPSSEVVGAVYNEIYISPSAIGGTRLEKFGSLYEKYLFDLLEFEYLPSVGSDTKGDVILAYDRDISDPTPPVSEQGVRQYTGMEDSKDGNVWTKHVIKCRLLAPDAGYYTNTVNGGDDRLAYQGQFYLACVVPSGEDAGTTLGRLRVRYRCHFFVPQLESSNLGVSIVSPTQTGTYSGSAGDFIAKIVALTPTISGNQNWTPKVDSSGKYYLDLAQGVYRMVSQFNAGSPGESSGAGFSYFSVPTLSVNEPAASPAPQPWIEQLAGVADETGGSGNYTAGAMTEYLLGVPKGGGKLYQNATLTTSLASAQNWNMLIDLFRQAGFAPAGSFGYALARWIGAQEVAQPWKYCEEAVKRVGKRQKALGAAQRMIKNELRFSAPKDYCPTIHSRSVPDIEEAHLKQTGKAPRKEFDSATLDRVEDQLRRLRDLQAQVRRELSINVAGHGTGSMLIPLDQVDL